MKYYDLPDALDGMEKAARAFLIHAGISIEHCRAIPDSISGTASVRHWRDGYGKLYAEIHFPVALSTARLSQQEVDRWTGYFLHELCHVLYTDDNAWQLACNERLHKITNGLEDVRIEREIARKAVAANAKKVLEELTQWAESKMPASYDPNDWQQLPWTLAYLGRFKVLGYDLPRAAGHYAQLTDAAIIAAIDAIARANSTHDCLSIARNLAKAGASVKQPPKGQGQGQGKSPQDEKGQGEGQGKSPQDEKGQGQTQDGEEGESNNGGVNPKPQTGETGDTTPDGSGGNGAGLNLDAMCDSEDLLDPRSDTTRLNAEKEIGTNNYLAKSNGGVIEIIRRLKENPRPQGKYSGMIRKSDKQLTNVQSDITKRALRCGKLKQQTARVLKAPDAVSWSRNQLQGRLDRYSLARIGMGATESVYGRRNYTTGYETEIILLIDGSGSMDGPCAFSASVFALALAQAAEQVAVKCEIKIFKDSCDVIAKPLNKRANDPETLAALTRAALSANGGTPLSRSLVDNANQLAKRAPNKRKIIFALTDGGCGDGPAVLKGAAQYAERLGVETVGLSLDTDVHGCFKYEVAISSRDDVASAGLGALVTVLENKAAA